MFVKDNDGGGRIITGGEGRGILRLMEEVVLGCGCGDAMWGPQGDPWNREEPIS